MGLFIKNLAELKLRRGSYDGLPIVLLGLNAVGDGGGNNYYWDSLSTLTNNDNTVVQVTGLATGRWRKNVSSSAPGINDAAPSVSTVYSSNKISELLALKATALTTQIMSGNFFKNTGTVENPIIEIDPIAAGFINALKIALTTLPNHDPINTNLFLNTAFNWVSGGAASLPQLTTPNMTFGTSSTSQNTINWLGVNDATSYTLQRADNSGFSINLTTIYTGALLTYTDTSLTANTLYYYRLKATAPGYTDSGFDTDSKTTAIAGDLTAPLFTSAIIADNLRTRIVALYNENLVIGNTVAGHVTVSGGKTVLAVSVSGPYLYIDVNSAYVNGNVITFTYTSAAGRLQDSPGNLVATSTNQSVTNNINLDPAAPTIIADDGTNTLDATHVLGDTEIMVSENNGVYTQFTGNIINIGDVAVATGYWKFKIKAISGRNESPISNSPAFTVANTEVGVPLTSWAFADWGGTIGAIVDENNITTAQLANYSRNVSDYKIPSAGIGWVQCDLITSDSSGDIGLDNLFNINRNANQYIIKMVRRGDNNILYCDASGVQLASVSLAPGVNTKLRITATGTNLLAQYTTNSGTSWTTLASIVQPVGNLYPKTFMGLFPNRISNVLYYNMTMTEPIPAAPTNMVVNDTTKTITWNNGATFFNSDTQMRYRVVGSIFTQWVGQSSTSFDAVGKEIAIGDFQVRTRALDDGRTKSATLLNDTAIAAPNPAANPPTNLIVDDTANTATWTLSTTSGITAADHEFSLNYTAATPTWFAATTNSKFVGNLNIPIGGFAVRVKLTASYSPSTVLTNSIAFIAVVETPIPLNDNAFVVSGPTTGATIIDSDLTIVTTNTFVVSDYYVPAGGAGWIMMDLLQVRTGMIGLDQGTIGESSNGFEIAMAFAFDAKLQGRALSGYFGTGEVLALSSNTKARVRCDGTQCHVEYTKDNMATWINVNSIIQPNVNLYVKAFLSDNPGGVMHNMSGYGLLGNNNPIAPTTPVVDDILQTIGWTNSTNIPSASDYEYTSNNGTTWIQCIANPQPIGDGNKASGVVKVRVRAITGRNKSNSISNASIYTVKTYSTVNLNSWPSLQNTVVTENTLDTPVNASTYGRAMSNMKLAVGTSGFVRFTFNQTSNQSGNIGFITNGADMNFGGNDYAIGLVMANNFKILGRKTNNYYSDEIVQTKASTLYGRVRGDGTYLYAEYSVDSGASWVLLHVAFQGAADLFVKSWMDVLPCQTSSIVYHNLTI